jgi:Mesyanzhinovviridae DNA primase
MSPIGGAAGLTSELMPTGDTEAAIYFLDHWHGEDPRIVITIHPDSEVTVRHEFAPGETDRMRRAIDAAQGRLNCYTPVNVAGPGRTSPEKEEMRAARAFHVDADLKDTGGDPDALLARLRSFDPPPSVITFSGGGYWPLWLLARPYSDGDWRDRIEQICGSLHRAAGANPTCRTVNRLMRLPGTVNVLSKKKRRDGRQPALAYVVEAHWDRRWSFADDPVPRLPEGAPGDVSVADEIQSLIHTGNAKRYGGDRSRLVFYIACFLVRAGWDDSQIADVLVNPANGVSAHVREQHKPAEYALKQARDAREKVAADLRSELAKVERLNAEYAVIISAGKVAVLREYEDEEGLPAFALMSAENFKLWLANLPGLIGGKRAVSVADFWLRHPDRRQYAGIGFMPENARPGWYNLWRGFAVERRLGRCDLFLAHLRDNVAQGDVGLFRWVEGWLADIVQRPARKCGTSLVLIGKQGVGKTIVGKAMKRLLGRHYVGANRPRYITGQFNSHLVRCLLLHADEGFWAGDKQAEGVLKDLVTGDTHLVELKNFEPIPVRNYMRLLVTSNEDWIIPAGMEERRFATLTVGEAHMKDRAYFAAIEEQLEDGGYEALLHHLLTLDLSQVNLGVIPVTAGLLDQKLESLSPIKRWWLTTLREGRLPGGCYAANTCPVKALYQRYLDHAAMTHLRSQRAIETQFGIALRKLMPPSRGGKPELLRFRDSYDIYFGGTQQTGYVYQLPSLTACRQHFERLIGQVIDWDGDVPDAPAGMDLIDEVEDDDWEKDALPTSGADAYHGSEVSGDIPF